MPPDDVRITKPAEGTVPVVAALDPAAPAPAAAVPVAEAAPAPAPAPAVPAAEPVAVAAPVVEAKAEPAPAAAEEMPTAQPTLFELAEQKRAEKDKPKEAAAEAAKPAAEGEKPKAEEKPAAEEKPVAEAKPAEAEKAAEPAKPAEAAPVVPKEVKFEYVLPESITLPEKETGELHGALTAFATNPSDKVAQQSLVDFHFARLADSIREYNKEAHKAFHAKRQEWQRAVMDHPELGGGNHDAAMQSIAYVRDNFLSSHPRGSKEYEAAKMGLDEWMHLTGAGDNPFFLEMMHNISVRLNEPQIQATAEIKPIVQQDNGGRPSIYKHPTSFPRR